MSRVSTGPVRSATLIVMQSKLDRKYNIHAIVTLAGLAFLLYKKMFENVHAWQNIFHNCCLPVAQLYNVLLEWVRLQLYVLALKMALDADRA